jgi:broad specificity phosphatase PhoE
MGVLVLVRHGQASFHEEDYDKLSPLGEEQCRHLGEFWVRNGITFDRVCSGPLARQRRSAEIVREVFEKAGATFPEITIVDAIAEMPVQQLAKRFMPQLCSEDEQVLLLMQRYMETEDKREKEKTFQKAFEKLMLLWANEQYQDGEIESFAHFRERVTRAYRAILDAAKKGERIAAFTSGGPTAVALNMALGTSAEKTLELVWLVRNASTTEFLFTNGRFSLSSFNSVPHLCDPMLWTYR